MKTLVVFSALISIALAAPAQQNKGLEDSGLLKNSQNLIFSYTPEYLKREKKSPSDLTSNTVVHIVPTAEIHTDDDTTTNTGRNTLNKPLIVKKKFGYRLYRDSEEEKANADSHETCGRQVKVKLCDEDGKFRQMLKSSAHESSNVPSFEDDMKNSIKMAKEAVENLQRDLKKMDTENPAEKQAHESESVNLHKDIEIARQALEHVHENLGNISPQDIMSKDSEDMSNANFFIAKSEEEKVAQWKEAMNNIQKNVEIATNIEDSFRATDHMESLLHHDQFESTKSGHKLEGNFNSHIEMEKDHHERNAQNMNFKFQPMNIQDLKTAENLNDHQSREDHSNDDMKSSASENIEMKSIDIKNHHPLRSENQKHHEQEDSDLHLTNSVVTSGEEHKTFAKDPVLESSTSTSTASVSKQQLHMQKIDNGMSDVDKNALFKNSHNIHSEEEQHNILLKESSNMSKEHLKHEITDNKNFHVKSVHNKTDTDQKDMMHKETDKNMHMAKDILREDHFDAESLEEANAQKMNNILKHNDFMRTASNINQKPTKQLVMDSNETDQQQMSSSTRTKSVEEDFPLKFVAQQHEDFIRAVDQQIYDHIQQEQNKNQNIGSKYKEVLTNMKSAEEDKQNNISMKNDDLTFQESHKHKKMEPNVKSILIKAKSSEDFLEVDKLQKKAESNEMSMGDVGHEIQLNEKQTEDGIMSNHKTLSTDMKSAEEPIRHHPTTTEHHMHNHHSHQSHHSKHDSRWGHENKHHDKNFHRKNLQLREDQHVPSKIETFHDEEMLVQDHVHAHPSERHHPNMMSNSNRHSMNVMYGDVMKPNFHSSMRDAMEGLESEHKFRWQSSRDMAGKTYPSSSSGGAVGVFPNANTGSCAIPLLLSCSPSVVSGSLAKAHPVTPPPYTAPSYRTEDDFMGFLSKRDLKKPNDGRSINILRAPTIPKQKFAAMLENKM